MINRSPENTSSASHYYWRAPSAILISTSLQKNKADDVNFFFLWRLPFCSSSRVAGGASGYPCCLHSPPAPLTDGQFLNILILRIYTWERTLQLSSCEMIRGNKKVSDLVFQVWRSEGVSRRDTALAITSFEVAHCIGIKSMRSRNYMILS